MLVLEHSITCTVTVALHISPYIQPVVSMRQTFTQTNIHHHCSCSVQLSTTGADCNKGCAAAGVNVMFLNGLPVDVPTGMELYPLLERISAEVQCPDYSPSYKVAAQHRTARRL